MFNPEIITPYGNIGQDLIDNANKVTKDYLENQLSAAELFFQDTIEITFEEIDSEIKDGLFDLIVDNRFTHPERILAVLAVSDAALEDITESTWADKISYEIEGGDEDSLWLVFTDDEADKATVEYIKDNLDDLTIFELFPDHMQEAVLMEDDLIDVDYFWDYMNESNTGYVEDIESESVNESPNGDDHINRLHEELCSEGLMDDPEWPEEPEDTDSDEWADWETEQQKMYSDIEDDCENHKDAYVEKMNDNYENGLEWYRDNFGVEELKEIVKNNELIDNEKVANWAFDNDYTNRGNELSGYDGQEVEVNIDYKGKNYDFFCYRTN